VKRQLRVAIEQGIARQESTSTIMRDLNVSYETVAEVRDAMDQAVYGDQRAAHRRDEARAEQLHLYPLDELERERHTVRFNVLTAMQRHERMAAIAATVPLDAVRCRHGVPSGVRGAA
jgi:hypothetical protein